ncbi:MAG: ATP-binding protein [Bacteroidales bacterium]|nr:ATP-binding protein [Bacteroidales bacterium]
MAKLIGRKSQTAELDEIMKSDAPEFVVIFGRRRIGKTYLINQYYDDKFTFKHTGLASKDKNEQLKNFGESLRRYGSSLCPDPKDWMEAFALLRTLLENKKSKGKKVVFIDELPYMSTPKSNLITALEHFWNDYGNTQNNLVLIICGSATSWIVKNIIKNKGGLHNRITRRIYLHPFTVSECKEFFDYKNIIIGDKDILECYMIMGGVPYYLSLMQRGKSLAQNVDQMFFKRQGKLYGEFDELYSSLFDESSTYIKVIEAIGQKNKGLSRKEIIKATGLPDGGTLTKILNDLDNCDFIRKYQSLNNKERNSIYQLTDFYSLFYLKFIKKYGTTDKEFWTLQLGTTIHNAWAGYAFEQFCLQHVNCIEKALGISGVQTRVSCWQSQKSENGAQIDLVISRADGIVNVCEMKFWNTKFTINKKYHAELMNKIETFRTETKCRQPIHLVMVTTYGIVQNEYSSIAQCEVTMDDFLA